MKRLSDGTRQAAELFPLLESKTCTADEIRQLIAIDGTHAARMRELMPHYPLAEQLREREHVLAAFDELLAKNFHTAPGVAAARGRRRRKYRKPANGTRPCAFDHSHLVELVRAGMCTSAIAQRLCTSQKTVRVIAQRAGLSIRSPQESDAG